MTKYWCGCGNIYDAGRHTVEIFTKEEKNKEQFYKRDYCFVNDVYKETKLAEIKNPQGDEKTFFKRMK